MAPIIAIAVKILAPMLIEKVAREVMSPQQKEVVVVDSLKGVVYSKTMWFSFVLALLGIIEQYSSLLTSFAGEQKTGTILMIVAAITAVLRSVTNSSLSEKVEK